VFSHDWLNMTFQNEEGIPLVEVQEQEQAKPSYSRTLMAIFAAAVLAATAYTSYEAGVSTGMQRVTTPMAMNKKDAEDGPSSAYHLGLPNDADGPLTNDGAKRQIVHHGFEKYKYLNGKNMAGRFAIPGHGMAQDGSPIPAHHDYEGDHVDVTVSVNFFGSIYKTYYQGSERVMHKLGTMEGLDKQDNIIFTDGDMYGHGNIPESEYTPLHGSIMIECGLHEKIVDYHMHSGHDNRITIHTPHFCPAEMEDPEEVLKKEDP